MKLPRYLPLVLLCSLFALNASAFAAPSRSDLERIRIGVRDFMNQVEELEGFAPGSVVAIATSTGQSIIRTDGVLNADLQNPVTPNSHFYIASMTKSYLGLLAAELDAEGVLSLEFTLADAWPDLSLPDGLDPAAITLRDLLSHQSGFQVSAINVLEAYVRNVAPEEYPELIEHYASRREPGYHYDNLGYNIYAAILEQQTGRNWRDWLHDSIFIPLGMGDTSARITDFPAETIAWGHQRDIGSAPFWPRANGWYLIPPKTDEQMQSAGGLVTSGSDLALFVQANLRRDMPGFMPGVFEAAQTPIVEQDREFGGFACNGYSLGWESCTYSHDGTSLDGSTPPPVEVLQHGGGYAGYRSWTTFSPDLGVGVSVAFNAEAANFHLGLEITKLVLELALELDGIEERNRERLDLFAEVTARYDSNQQSAIEEATGDTAWGEGAWLPDESALSEFEGTYSNPQHIVPDLRVRLTEGQLTIHGGSMMRYLAPVSADIFAAYDEPTSPPDRINIARNSDGAVVGLRWDGDYFARNND